MMLSAMSRMMKIAPTMMSQGFVFIFFFSSRRRHTRLTCDWSSDVCSSDLRDQDRRYRGGTALPAEPERMAAVGIELQHARSLRELPDPENRAGAADCVAFGADDFAGAAEIGRASCRERV